MIETLVAMVILSVVLTFTTQFLASWFARYANLIDLKRWAALHDALLTGKPKKMKDGIRMDIYSSKINSKGTLLTGVLLNSEGDTIAIKSFIYN